MPVDSLHPEYESKAPVWQQCRDCIAGERAIKAAGIRYLPRLTGQTGTEGDNDYKSYLSRAMFYPATGRTVEGLMGAILRKEPAVEMPESLKGQLADVTQAGRSFLGFTIDVLEELFAVGRGGIMLDMPKDAGMRPYWVRFTAEQIINWHSQKVIGTDGREIERLTLVVLKLDVPVPEASDKFKTETVCQYQVLELLPNASTGRPEYTVTIYTKPKDAKEWTPGPPVVPMRRGQTFDEIPFVFFGPRDTTPAVDKPPMEDLTNVNLSHFRTSADLETGCHYVAIPTPVVSGVRKTDTVFKIGASTAWVLEDPQAKAEFLEFKGQGLSALEARQEKKEHLMATIGARLLESQPSKQETAAAVRMRHSGEHATLTTIVVSVSEALTQVLQWHCWWAGLEVQDDEVSVSLNTEFFDHQMSPEESKALLLEWQSGSISYETYYWNLQRGGKARPGVTAEQEQKTITAETPEPEPPPDRIVDPNIDPDDVDAQRRPAA